LTIRFIDELTIAIEAMLSIDSPKLLHFLKMWSEAIADTCVHGR
jgi:hypothetical protein